MSRTQRVLFWLAAFAVFVLSIQLLKPILLPFVAGLGVAYLLDPLADWLEERGFSRIVATTLITIGFFTFLIGILIIIAPVLQAQILGIAERLPEFIRLMQTFATDVMERLKAALPDGALETGGSVSSDIAGAFGRTFKNLAQSLWAGGIAVFQVLSLVVITPIVSFYMLLKWDDIIAQIDELLPLKHADTIREQVREIDRTLSGFLRGQASVCLVLGLIYAISLSIIGLEGGLLIGIGAGAVSFVPYVGAITGITVAMSVALVQFDTLAPIIAVAVVFGIGQMLESYVLTPRLVGDRVGLHDLWIIFAVMTGGALFEFVGVLLAVPTAAVIGVLVRFSLDRYRKSALYIGDEADNKPSSS